MKFKLLKQRLSFKNKILGFTLLEVLIVIALTATIAGVGISSYIGQQRAKALDNTVQEIVSFLRYAQQKSIAQEQGGQWGVHFENSLEQGSFYALNFDPDSGAFQNNHNLVKIIKDKILSFFRPFYAFARVITETERHYLLSGIKYQIPEDNDHVYILFQSLTGFLSLGDSYPKQPYQQIILEDSARKTANIVVCKQGLITYNEDIGICGELDFTPPEVGEIVASNTCSGFYVSSPFKLSATIHEPEGRLFSCEYTINGGSDWYEATKSGTGPTYTCTKTGITAKDGASLTLNIRAKSEGGTGIGTAIQKTVDAIAPTCSDNWGDNDWVTSSPVNIAINCSDNRSGIASTKYCIDTKNTCSPNTTYASSVSITCANGSTCVQYLRYGSMDKVNNQSIIYSSRIRQDRQAPTDGVLSAEPDEAEVLLSWTNAVDSGSGLATPNTYKVVFSTDSFPAANCTNGTEIYLGPATSFTHKNLTNFISYYYRVCAFDAVGNISTGVTVESIPYFLLENYEVCTEDNRCLSGHCYIDEDRDGYSSTTGIKRCQPSPPLGEGDCCDSNADVFPGQDKYFDKPHDCEEWDNKWDYNCDGIVTKENGTYRSASLGGGSTSCYLTNTCGASQKTCWESCTSSTYNLSCGQSVDDCSCMACPCYGKEDRYPVPPGEPSWACVPRGSYRLRSCSNITCSCR